MLRNNLFDVLFWILGYGFNRVLGCWDGCCWWDCLGNLWGWILEDDGSCFGDDG